MIVKGSAEKGGGINPRGSQCGGEYDFWEIFE